MRLQTVKFFLRFKSIMTNNNMFQQHYKCVYGIANLIKYSTWPLYIYKSNHIIIVSIILSNLFREADATSRFNGLIDGMSGLYVPRVYTEFSSNSVLVTEFIYGTPLGDLHDLSQRTRDAVTLHHLFTHFFQFVFFSIYQ